MTGAKLSEYHTGYRAFSSTVLRSINFEQNSEDYIFDNQILSQVILHGFTIGEITCPAKYFPEASSINFRNSVRYGFGVLQVSIRHFLQRHSLASFKVYEKTVNRNVQASHSVAR
jgi:hypothetical protein